MHRLFSCFGPAPTKTILSGVLLLLCCNPLIAQISGPLNGILEAGTYQVIGDISVEAGDSLTIEPGTVFQFGAGFNFNIYGYLEAVGTPSDSIYFIPMLSGEPWGSIIFRSGSSHNSQLSYSVITGAAGSAINCYWVDVTISHCTIINNTANWGGGIYISYANPTISHCYVAGNQSVNNGGGIYCTRSSPTISYCTVIDNSCNIGGAGSGRGGGGICVNHSSSPTIEYCVVQDNYSAESGGGISINDDCHPQISYCDITGNSADTSGGGIYVNAVSNPIILYSSITGNGAPKGGGICILGNSIPTITNLTIAENQASYLGGGIYCTASAPTVVNSILWGDIAAYGQEISLNDTSNLIITYSDLHHGQDSVYVQPGSTLDWGEGMIDADPIFVNPDSNDFHLWSHSPCIDAGDPGSPFDPDSTLADMGAYYYHQTGTPNPIDDLVAAIDSIDITLFWSPTTEDLLGNPITISTYRIYRSTNPNFLPSIISLIDSTADTTYTDPGIISSPEPTQFYKITAVPITE